MFHNVTENMGMEFWGIWRTGRMDVRLLAFYIVRLSCQKLYTSTESGQIGERGIIKTSLAIVGTRLSHLRTPPIFPPILSALHTQSVSIAKSEQAVAS